MDAVEVVLADGAGERSPFGTAVLCNDGAIDPDGDPTEVAPEALLEPENHSELVAAADRMAGDALRTLALIPTGHTGRRALREPS